MSPALLLGLAAGVVFGAGLAVSGMADPMRVRGFLDVFGAFDPTLLFVMGGAILPMALAWRAQKRMTHPLAGEDFAVPTATRLDAKLLVGAALFGVGWGIAGLCPGPALAGLALVPAKAGIFVLAMAAGMALQRFLARRFSL